MPKRGNLLFIKLVKSHLHEPRGVQDAAKSLGFRKMNQLTVHQDTPTIRGLAYSCRNITEIQIIPTSKLFPRGLTEKDFELQEGVNDLLTPEQRKLREWKSPKEYHRQKRIEKKQKKVNRYQKEIKARVQDSL